MCFAASATVVGGDLFIEHPPHAYLRPHVSPRVMSMHVPAHRASASSSRIAQMKVKVKRSADCIFDVSRSYLFWWQGIGQHLDMLGIALPDGTLIDASSGNHPLSGVPIISSSSQSAFQHAFPVLSDVKHEQFDVACLMQICAITPMIHYEIPEATHRFMHACLISAVI